MFEVGDIIRFKYTGDRAEIIEDLLDGSYVVWLLDDDDESIAFFDDIVLEKDFSSTEKSEFMQKHEKIPTLSTEELFFSKQELKQRLKDELTPYQTPKQTPLPANQAPPIFIPEIEETAATDSGVYLAFVGEASSYYIIYLVNDTEYTHNFKFSLYLDEEKTQYFYKNISPYTFFPIGEFKQAEFNDSPKIEFEAPDKNVDLSIKLKYKQFLKKRREVPLMGLEGYCFRVIENFNPFEEKGSTQSLREYTENMQLPKQQTAPEHYQRKAIEDAANFKNEIDLHIEKLVANSKKMSSYEIFQHQLESFEEFLEKALKYYVDEVFIIHGLGSGKLKIEIDQRLRRKDYVLEHKNEYIAGYGYGATRVRLKIDY